MAISKKEAHILIFPYPAQGHMIPLLDLTHQLIINGVTVTVIVTPKNLHLLNPLLTHHRRSPAIKTLILPFPSHPSIPAGVENTKDLPTNIAFKVMTEALGQLHNPIVDWFKSHRSPEPAPTAMITDVFLGWTEKLACEVGVKRIVFCPMGALALSVIYSLWRDLPRREQNDVVLFRRVPNCPEFPWLQISPMYRSYADGEQVGDFIKELFTGNIKSWGLIINTFSSLEGIYLDHLMTELGHNRVWAVGPTIANLYGPDYESRGGSTSISARDRVSWLDTCDDNSVVYVCFGSQTSLTSDQMAALAHALEISSVRFIWCVKDHECYNVVPSGFENRTVDKGLIIRGWAPQLRILRHRAVGAFFTHCGWNSVLEVLVAGDGALLLTWPMGADQFANDKLLVDELKVATRICEGANAVPDSVELAKTLVKSVSENRVERERMRELCRAAVEAGENGGSSTKDLEELVKHLGDLYSCGML